VLEADDVAEVFRRAVNRLIHPHAPPDRASVADWSGFAEGGPS
jgi:hypothetical protein